MNTELTTGQTVMAYLILVIVIAVGVTVGIGVSNKLL